MGPTKLEVLQIELKALVELCHVSHAEYMQLCDKVTEKRKEINQQVRKEQQTERELFFQQLGREHGVLEHPKFKNLCGMAWDDAHSEGLDAVSSRFETLVSLIK